MWEDLQLRRPLPFFFIIEHSGSAEESTDLPFGFFHLGSPETSEETTSFPFGLFAVRSFWNFLLEFIV